MNTLNQSGFLFTQTSLTLMRLSAPFGDGYKVTSVIGASDGMRTWTVKIDALPGGAAQVPLIDGKTRAQYLWDFVLEFQANGDAPFWVQDPVDDLFYLAEFVDEALTYEILCSKVYSTGLQLKQRRVRGRTSPIIGPPAPRPILYILRDEFAGLNGTANAARKPVPIDIPGNAWVNVAGAGWKLKDGYLTPGATFADGDHQKINAGTSKVVVSAWLTGFDGGTEDTKSMPGLVFSYVDSSNFWVVNVDTKNEVTTLYKQIDGEFTSMGTLPAPTSGVRCIVSVYRVGAQIRVELGGQAPLLVTDTDLQDATFVGVRAGGAGGAHGIEPPRFDDFTVIPAWERVAGNPFIVKQEGTWKSVDVAAPSQMQKDSVRGVWAILFSAFDGDTWRTGITRCPLTADLENPANWVEKEEPAFEPETDEGYIAASADLIIDEDGVYWAIVQIAPGSSPGVYGGPWRFIVKKSTDGGETWTTQNGGVPVLPLGAPGTFDYFGQHDPCWRRRDDGEIQQAFSGNDAGVTGAYRGGGAVGTDYTHFAPSALLNLNSTSGIGNFAFGGTDPMVYSIYYVRTFDGDRYMVREDTKDGGLTFQYIGAVFYKSVDGEWDSEQVFDPANPTVVGNKLYMPYGGATEPGGVEDLNAGVGLAVLDIPAFD